ncbi:MAG: hypothetical protein ACRD0U_08570, partial [Acidimicrobiales bacterium]
VVSRPGMIVKPYVRKKPARIPEDITATPSARHLHDRGACRDRHHPRTSSRPTRGGPDAEPRDRARLIGGGLIATALAFGEHLDDDALAEMVAVIAAGLTARLEAASIGRAGDVDRDAHDELR